MPGPLTTTWMQSRVGTYDGATLGVLLIDADGAAAAATTMVFVSEVVANELGGSYVRGTIDMALTVDGGSQILDFDPLGTPYTTNTTGLEPAGAWFYDTSGGSDAARKLLFFLPVEVGAGFADWPLDPPADGRGCVRVRALDDELIAAVAAALTIEGTPL